ncbi:GluClalpha:-like isoform F, partial [Leptotrombidium deliense]
VNVRVYEQRTLNKILAKDVYDPQISPQYNETSTTWKFAFNTFYNPFSTGSAGPAIVKHNFFVRQISEIDSKKMEMKVQLTYRMQWNDIRLQYDDLNGQIRYLHTRDVNRIWTPDTFVSNEIDGHFHDIFSPNVLLRIYPNGDVLFSTRLSLTLSCPMDLRAFPKHRIECMIKLASYAYTTEDLLFLWKEGDPI